MPRKLPVPKPVLLIDEAIHLLRRMPLPILAVYYVATVPFVLVLLYFLADMFSSAYAWRYAAPAALLMATLYLWMKTGQARFCAHLWAQISGVPVESWSARRIVQVGGIQLIIHSVGLFLFPLGPLSLALVLPFFVLTASLVLSFIGLPGLLYVLVLLPLGMAFLQSAQVFSALPESDLKRTVKRARRHMTAWFGQNILLCFLLGLGASLTVFFVWHLTAVLPMLLKMFLGVETPISRAGVFAAMNSAVLAVVLSVTYLLLDPVVKAVYVLRAFYSESRRTGDDLLAELKVIQTAKQPLVLLALLFVLLCAFPSSAAPPSVEPDRLDQSIERTLRQRRYSWRMPREKLPEQTKREAELADAGWLQRFAHSLGESLEGLGDWLGEVTEGFVTWLQGALPDLNKTKRSPKPKTGPNRFAGFGNLVKSLIPLLKLVLILALLVSAVIVVFKLVKFWRTRRSLPEAESTGSTARPDLEREDVTADELPEDQWLQLAQEQLQAGDLRLAVRALYLGSLAYLAEQRLIQIKKFKSNRDYLQELLLRDHALPQLVDAFQLNTQVYDCIWYGMHEVTEEKFQTFQANTERIRERASTS